MEVAQLLEGRYAHCPRITLVCDNLNTHSKGAYYQAFEPVRVRELLYADENEPFFEASTDENEPLRAVRGRGGMEWAARAAAPVGC